MTGSVSQATLEAVETPRRLEQRDEQEVWNISPELRQALLEALAPTRPESPAKMSYEEFLARADEDTLAEWVDGEMIMTSPASRQHQDLADFLTSVLRAFVEQHEIGAVLSAPFQVKLEQGREPDLVFVSQERLDRLRENRVEGAPDLVIEIISPESVGRDRGEKYDEYERGGVPEYWLIDPQVRWAAIYNLDAEGRYRPSFTGTEGVFRSSALNGLWLRAEWLWQPPRVVQVLRELKVI